MTITNYLENKTKKIETSGDIIIYTLKRDKSKHYFTYNETLLALLSSSELTPFAGKHRLRFSISQKGVSIKIYAYDLALACYMGRVNETSFIVDVQHFLGYKAMRGLNVDHMDNYVSNNTNLNLLLMIDRCNQSKGNLTAKVTAPSNLVCCYVDGRILIQFTEVVKNHGYLVGCLNRILEDNGLPLIIQADPISVTRGIVCHSAEDFVDCLKSITATELLTDGMPLTKPLRTPRGWANQKDTWDLDNALSSILQQKALSVTDISKFTTWNSRNE